MNINANGHRRGTGNSFVEPENEIKKYLRILRKRLWLILSVFVLVFAGWVGYVAMYDSQPLYTAETLLHFQDARKVGALDGDNGRRVNESRVTTLTTNKLMEQVVEELQLNLSVTTEGVDRNDLFRYVNVSFNSVDGQFKVLKSTDQIGKYSLLYTNPANGIEDKLLTTFAVEDTVRLANYSIAFALNSDFVKGLGQKFVEFKIRDTDRAISTLRNMIGQRWLDRRNMTYLEISATHSSPVMAAKVANTLATRFVEFDSRIKNRKSNEAEKNLKSQLDISKEELEIANQRLQVFREKNPDVIEGRVATSLATLEQGRATAQFKQNEIRQLIQQIRETEDFDEKSVRVRELVQYLLADGLPSGTAFDSEMRELTTARNEMYTKQFVSPAELRENEARFNALFNKIIDLATSHIDKLSTDVTVAEQNILNERGKLSALPRKERELTAFVRDQEVKQRLYEDILLRYNQAKLSNEVEVGDVFIMDEARIPPLQSSWKIVLQKSLLGLMLGIGLGIALAIVLEFFDKTVQTAEDLEGKLKFPVIGSIPVIYDENDIPDNVKDIKGKRDAKLITLDYSPTLESESYRDLRTKLLFLSQKQKLGSFVMTSLRPNEGKSLTCANLAITFAQQKISTLLIDADLRRGVLHNVFGNRKKPGLGDFLVSKATVDYENIKKLIQKTIIPNLHIITTGSPIPNPTEMLGSERMNALLNMLKQHYGMVILDTAPFQASSDAPILTRNVDGLVVVVRADYTNVEQIKKKLREYAQIQDSLLGLVLNMVKTDVKKERYQYSYYNY